MNQFCWKNADNFASIMIKNGTLYNLKPLVLTDFHEALRYYQVCYNLNVFFFIFSLKWRVCLVSRCQVIVFIIFSISFLLSNYYYRLLPILKSLTSFTFIMKQTNTWSIYHIDPLPPFALYCMVTLHQSQISLHPLDPYNSTNSSLFH